MKKLVVKLEINGDKAKQIKALKAVATFQGIDSIEVDMKEKKLTVIGTVDPVNVVSKLRKYWQTDMISVGPAKEPEKLKEEPKPEGDEQAKKLEGGGKEQQQQEEEEEEGPNKKPEGGGNQEKIKLPGDHHLEEKNYEEQQQQQQPNYKEGREERKKEDDQEDQKRTADDPVLEHAMTYRAYNNNPQLVPAYYYAEHGGEP